MIIISILAPCVIQYSVLLFENDTKKVEFNGLMDHNHHVPLELCTYLLIMPYLQNERFRTGWNCTYQILILDIYSRVLQGFLLKNVLNAFGWRYKSYITFSFPYENYYTPSLSNTCSHGWIIIFTEYMYTETLKKWHLCLGLSTIMGTEQNGKTKWGT